MKTTPGGSRASIRIGITLGCILLALPTAAAAQQGPATADEEERMDEALRKFGYVSVTYASTASFR